MAAEYEWKRFWCPRGGTVNLSDGGFLYDPESKYGKDLSPGLVTFDHLAEKPSLALLGEPGIGKSRALQTERANVDKSIAGAGGRSFWLDLRSFGSEDRLWKDLFEAQELEQWRRGDYILHLFLDSLDECLLRIDNVAALIADQLPKEPVSRLRVRIACRTARWPNILENAFVAAFGKDGFVAYELVPLRRKDVRHALEQSHISEPNAFLDRVQALDASSLAIKPVTLNFLINTYLRDGDLPVGQIELYERGCRILCEEPNESRLAASRRGLLSADQRFAVASRIAAVTQFCNRFAIWTDTEAAGFPQEDILVKDLTGREEVTLGEFSVTEEGIRDVLDTGLFSSRGQGRIGWAHQTYAEFLAAHYCVRHDMPAQQLNSLLFHPERGGRRLVPQLYELAAWLSVMDSRVLRDVVGADPESLLGAAGASLAPAQRKLVVQSLLDQSDNGRLLHLRWNLFRLYPKLKHPGLADHLKPYLRDNAKSANTRHVAIDIAHACEVEQLGADLADVALDASEEMSLRLSAGKAAAEVGSQEVKGRLRPFAFGQVGDDPQDELKGVGLTALWPGLISATELFPLLTRPKERNFYGAYSSFLYYLAPTLKADHLPAALEWFSGQKQRDIGPIDTLMDNIVLSALQNMDTPDVLVGLAKAILSRVRLQDHLLSDRRELDEELCNDDIRRQALLRELLPHLQENELFFLDYAGVRVVPESDLPWLIRRIETRESPTTENLQANLVRRIVDTSQPDQMRMLWLACQTNAVLNERCNQLFWVPLDSEEVRMLRENLQRRQQPAGKLLDPPPEARVEQDLANIEQGKLVEWVQLTRDLSLKPTSTQWDLDNPDLAALPGWASSTDVTRERIVAAAVRYVDEGEPENDKWFNTSQIYFSAIAGFQALALLLSVTPRKLETLSATIWTKWVPIILKYPHVDTGKSSLRLRLLQMACARTPREVAMRLLQVIDSDNNGHGYVFVDREIDLCWDENLGTDLLSKAREPHLKPTVVKTILDLLLRHEVPGSLELAKSFIVVPPPGAGTQKELMVGAIEALISGTHDAGWQEIWPVMRDYPDFGRVVVGSVSYASPGAATFVEKLNEDQLGTFYIWLLTNYPPSPLDHRGAGAMGPSQTAVMLRDQVLEHLKRRGTFAACDAIRNVMGTFRQYSWLAFHLEEAESLARAATWHPVSPQQLLALASDRSTRLVETEEQLLDAIVESLDRLQDKMHDELPAAMHLWSVLPNDKLRPKYEEDLSDYVALHLREDLRQRGIVLNREVQIRRNPGQKTDIHVDAVILGMQEASFDIIRAIIEAKGDWNPELDSAMETQLRDQYLKDNHCRYGLYLVGWFYCDQWDDEDYRKKNCPRMPLEKTREQFSNQASALSTNGYHLRSYVLDIRAA
jgi:hypothetical protein